ncbi:MAG TPA: hypothetical protein VFJ16_28650 [Longimicrobium sp.]|nr:hypothetical protein [Longimicrobium sp.]
MRKITLDLDALAVDSFQTAAATASVGTVRAHDDEAAGAVTQLCTRACTQYSCPVPNTEIASCQYFCDCTIKGSPC